MDKFIKQRIRLVRLTTNDTTLIKSKLKYVKSINNITELGYVNGFYNYRVDYTYYSPLKYEALVEKLVAEKYSVGEESAIQRKAIMNGITDEFRIYNAYVEECKVKAKQFIQERESVLNDK